MDKVGFLLVGLMGIALVSCGGKWKKLQEHRLASRLWVR